MTEWKSKFNLPLLDFSGGFFGKFPAGICAAGK